VDSGGRARSWSGNGVQPFCGSAEKQGPHGQPGWLAGGLASVGSLPGTVAHADLAVPLFGNSRWLAAHSAQVTAPRETPSFRFGISRAQCVKREVFGPSRFTRVGNLSHGVSDSWFALRCVMHCD
jgi:hypothetical protein